jgi:hypothetical protein
LTVLESAHLEIGIRWAGEDHEYWPDEKVAKGLVGEATHLSYNALPIHPSRYLSRQRETGGETHPSGHRHLLLLLLLLLRRLLSRRLTSHPYLPESLLHLSLRVGRPILLLLLLLREWRSRWLLELERLSGRI